MTGKIISIHSFRGGTGKSNITANIATCIASKGNRVGVIDTDIQSPGIHVIFGFDESGINESLNDYLWGRCAVKDIAYDVTSSVGLILLCHITDKSTVGGGMISNRLENKTNIKRLNGWLI